MVWRTWRTAMTEALYGPDGFYRRPEGPAGHFRTSVHTSPRFAAAVLSVAAGAGLRTVVDIGAGRGELLLALRQLDPGIRLHGVDLAARPPHLPHDIGWSTEVPDVGGALVFANEWLDAIPLDIVEQTDDGPRLVEVDMATGAQRLAGPPSPQDEAWLTRWWPLDGAEPGDRAEIGWPRDDAWARAVARVDRGLAIAVDYGHERDTRPPAGTLTSYLAGRMADVVPDGSRDLSVHVAIDACAAAGERAGASSTLLTTQRTALRALGVRGARPPVELARADPQAYLRGLQTAGQDAELISPSGLGRFLWLVQGVGMPLPRPLTAVPTGGPRSRRPAG